MAPGTAERPLEDARGQGLEFCWACWQPQVVALATPVVVADHPIYVLNMSVTGDSEAKDVVERLRDPLLGLRRRLQDAISDL